MYCSCSRASELASGLIVFPWMVQTPAGWASVGSACVTCVAVFALRGKLQSEGDSWLRTQLLKPGEAAFWGCSILTAAIFMTGWLGDGDFAWLHDGFCRSDESSPKLAEPPVWCNLPALLVKAGWGLNDKLWQFDFAGSHLTLTLQLALRLGYLILLVLCAIPAARHLRNRDPKLLISLAVPWLLMFALLGQMHSRYLMWGAVVSTLSLAVNLRLSLLHFIFSLFCTAMILARLILDKHMPHPPVVLGVIDKMRPCGAYIVLACVAVYFIDSFWRSRPTRVR